MLVIMGCCYLGDEDVSHVPRGDDQRGNQAAGRGAPGGPREGCVGDERRGGAGVRPADRRAPPKTQRRPQDGEDEGEGTGGRLNSLNCIHYISHPIVST